MNKLDNAVRHMLRAYKELQQACLYLEGADFTKTHTMAKDLASVIDDLMTVIKTATDEQHGIEE